jgi:site-specific recombinase XerD
VKTVDSNKTALDEFLRIVGDLPLHKVGIREIEAFLARKKDEASVWTARKYYLALAATFETARRWGHISTNPWRLVQKPKVPELLPTFFTRKEFVHLLEFIDDSDFRDLVLTAVSTGMRRGELIALKWESVDLVRRVIVVQNTDTFTTKNRRTRVIPMNAGLQTLLLRRCQCRASNTELVFHDHGKALRPVPVSVRFKAYVRAAELKEAYHFHTLRHSFCTWLVESGASLYAVAKLAGHCSISTTQGYAHLAPSSLTTEVERISLAV